MGMSTHVYAFRAPDEHWQKMADAWNACVTAGVDPPDEVQEFFNWEKPDPAGVEVKIPYRDYEVEMADGIEIDVKDIPEGVSTIRFVNSW